MSCLNKDGYVEEYNRHHPLFPSKKKILQHRRIIAEHLGRELDRMEIVHHINGNRTDNRLENLELTTYSKHNKHHRGGKKRPPFSQEWKDKIREGRKKQVMSAEHIAALVAGSKRRWAAMSPEERKARVEATIGKANRRRMAAMSPEQRAKIGADLLAARIHKRGE